MHETELVGDITITPRLT